MQRQSRAHTHTHTHTHTAKIVTRVLRRRVERKIEDVHRAYRFGFRRGGGTKDAVGILRIIISEGNMYIDEELCA
jgi:hypothetical protein